MTERTSSATAGAEELANRMAQIDPEEWEFDLSKTDHTARVIDLLFAARRVWKKFGHDEAGVESDWSEWTDLRDAIAALRDADPKLFATSLPQRDAE